jgi:hypothetical protein
VKGKKRCRFHGAWNGGKRTPDSAAVRQAKKRAQVELSDLLWERQKLKERQPKPIVWEPEPPRSLEEQFRPAPRKRGWTPYGS